MTQPVDPRIDCVFKALLGDDKNKNLLIHFLNSVLDLKGRSRIIDVDILNPYNEKEFIGDKLSVVDIKAKDENDKNYQIEIQIQIHDYLISRMIYNWANIYQAQMREGNDYESLKPVISIWILGGSLFPRINKCHLAFKFTDLVEKLVLSDHAAIHVFQLPKWKKNKKIISEKDRWLCLFKEGRKLDYNDPPEHFQTKEMRQVMRVLKRFSERERDALMYQHRKHQLAKEQTFLNLAKKGEQALKKAEQAFKERDEAFVALKKNEKALKEKEKEINRLQQLLKS